MRIPVFLVAITISVASFNAAAFFERASEEDKIIQAVYEAPGADKAKIMAETKKWIAENFRSAKSTIDHEDQAEGLLIVKGNIAYPCSGLNCIAKGQWTIPFTMRIDVKEERFRLTFTNVSLSMPEVAEIWQKSEYEVIKPRLLGMGEEIRSAISSSKSKADW